MAGYSDSEAIPPAPLITSLSELTGLRSRVKAMLTCPPVLVNPWAARGEDNPASGPRLVTAGGPHVQVWESRGDKYGAWSLALAATLENTEATDETNGFRCLTRHDDGCGGSRLVASSQHGIVSWEGEPPYALVAHHPHPEAVPIAAKLVFFSLATYDDPDTGAPRIISVTPASVSVRDGQTLDVMRHIGPGEGAVFTALHIFSGEEGQPRMATGDSHGHLTVWSPESAEALHVLGPTARSGTISALFTFARADPGLPPALRLVSVKEDSIAVWDPATGEFCTQLRWRLRRPIPFRVACWPRRGADGEPAGDVVVMAMGSTGLSVWGGGSEDPLLPVSSGFDGDPTSLEVVAREEGGACALVGLDEGGLQLHDLVAGEALRELSSEHEGGVLVFQLPGRRVVAALASGSRPLVEVRGLEFKAPVETAASVLRSAVKTG
jgi:hypothetical protein